MWMWLQTYFHVDDEKFRCLLNDSPAVCWLLAIGPLAAGWLAASLAVTSGNIKANDYGDYNSVEKE